MKIRIIALITTVTFFNLAFTNCFANIFQKSKLPNQMPENVRMTFSENGGMAPTWYKVEISNHQIIVEDKKMNDEEPKKWYAKITDEEKTTLYRLFVKNKFDLIENQEQKEIVYDAGSASVRIRAGKVSKYVPYGMNSPLSNRNLAKYKQLAGAIKNLAKKYEATSKEVKNNFVQIQYYQTKNSSIFKEGKRTNITYSEIELVEELINSAVKNYNTRQNDSKKIHKLEEYKHQLVGIINKDDEKEVWVNSFCSVEKKWKQSLINVLDGGNCYFNLYLNLTKKTYRNLKVNGEA